MLHAMGSLSVSNGGGIGSGGGRSEGGFGAGATTPTETEAAESDNEEEDGCLQANVTCFPDDTGVVADFDVLIDHLRRSANRLQIAVNNASDHTLVTYFGGSDDVTRIKLKLEVLMLRQALESHAAASDARDAMEQSITMLQRTALKLLSAPARRGFDRIKLGLTK
jgi:hypothetical protein